MVTGNRQRKESAQEVNGGKCKNKHAYLVCFFVVAY